MDERAQFDAFLLLVEELVEANDTTPILVEGKRDVAALRELGCRGEILVVHTGEPLFALVERLAAQARQMVLLTDWDRKGDRFAEELGNALGAHGVRVDRSFRDKLPAYARMSFKDVESMPAHVARGLAKFHGKELAEHAAARAFDLHDLAARLGEEFQPDPLPEKRKRRK